VFDPNIWIQFDDSFHVFFPIVSDVSNRVFPTIQFDQLVFNLRHNLSPSALIKIAADGDDKVEASLKERWKNGEPAPYVSRFFYFRDRYFRITDEAYITDPEATYLVDAVEQMGLSLMDGRNGFRPMIAEFGVGAGTLSISVALDCPFFRVTGFDLDPNALEVARMNQEIHKTDVNLFESDYFKSWPHSEPPDLVFADPPWGTREDLYDDERDADYYDKMPPCSAYPSNGRIGLHEGIVHSLRDLGWKCPVVMNLGVIPPEVYQPLLDLFKQSRLYAPTSQQRILIGYVN